VTFEDWFASRGWSPFGFQRDVWAAYRAGESGLIHAATGTGKTLAAWGGPVSEWLDEQTLMPANVVGRRPRRSSAPPLRVVWITPLRALAADTEEALRQPLVDLGLPWTLESRTGDTSAAMRARQARRLPTALVTTPESLSLMLSREHSREMFADLRAVVVDEWHELMGTKRGVLVELALARLRYYQPRVRIWGLSATIGNLQDALDALLGVDRAARRGRIVRGVEPKDVVIDALIPPVVERFPWAGHLGTQMLPR
jgi:ATP-dependent Lhr-like helicase